VRLEYRLVEAQHLSQLLDGGIQVVPRLRAIPRVAQSADRISKLSLELRQRVALNVDTREGAAIQLRYRDVPVTRQNTRLLIGHLPMIASGRPPPGPGSPESRAGTGSSKPPIEPGTGTPQHVKLVSAFPERVLLPGIDHVLVLHPEPE